MEGREDLAPRALRGNPRDVRDDEVLAAEALGRHDLLLDLADLSAGEFGFGPEEDRADPSLSFAASIRHPVEVIARHVNRSISVRKTASVRREHEVSGHGLVDWQAATQPFAQHPVEEVRLVPMDEHEEEIERKHL